MSKQISLTGGWFAVVDDEDYIVLSQYRWEVCKGINTQYARLGGHGIRTTMHQMIMNTPKGMETDHIDGNGLNNQKSNLRVCTHQDNQHNAQKRKDNTSGYKGVTWNKQNKAWKSQITFNNKSKFLGYYKNPISAAIAYDNAAIELFGEYANINFP